MTLRERRCSRYENCKQITKRQSRGRMSLSRWLKFPRERNIFPNRGEEGGTHPRDNFSIIFFPVFEERTTGNHEASACLLQFLRSTVADTNSNSQLTERNEGTPMTNAAKRIRVNCEFSRRRENASGQVVLFHFFCFFFFLFYGGKFQSPIELVETKFHDVSRYK